LAIKVRKKTRNISDLSEAEKYMILDLYIKGQNTVREIGEKVSLTRKDCDEFLLDFYTKLVNRRETNSLIASTNLGGVVAPHKFNHPSYVNDKFLSLLSPPDSEELTQEELNYCYLLVETNDNIVAMKESGMDVGLLSSGRNKADKEKYLMLRSRYLQKKSNVSSMLSEMRDKKYDEITKTLSPVRLQHELLEQYEASKAAGDRRSAISLLRQLGESIAMFSNKLQIEDVNPDKVLTNLIEMAKEAEVIE